MNVEAVVASGALWAALPIAVLAGLISFISPCVLPLVPGYLGFLGGSVQPRADRVSTAVGGTTTTVTGTTPVVTKSRLLLGVLLFIAGFTVVFVAFATLGGVGNVFLARWEDLITRIMGVVVIAMGLIFIGLFSFAQRTVKFQVRSGAGLIGAPLLGIAMGIGWTPCMGPTLATIFALSWNVGDPGRAALLGVAYSLGLGVPFILIALGFGWASRSVNFLRRHIRVVNIIGGALLILVGLLMVTGAWTAFMRQIGSVMQNVNLPL